MVHNGTRQGLQREEDLYKKFKEVAVRLAENYGLLTIPIGAANMRVKIISSFYNLPI